MDTLVTDDMTAFSFRELEVAAKLLTAYVEECPKWMYGSVQLMLSKHSGFVFLIDDESNSAMLNDGKLEPWLSLPATGEEGFYDDLMDYHRNNGLTMHPDDLEYMKYWAEILKA